MDIIKIKQLEIFANHGVLKEENVLGQKFLVNAELYVDTREAGKNDDLDKSVNYANVCDEIRDFVRNNTFKLIEAVAEKLCEHILLEFDKVKGMKLEIRKPWAPIMQSVDYVSVEIERGWKKAYIAIGSNMGDKVEYLTNAVNALEADKKCRVTAVSPFYLTAPVGDVEQDDFLNGCIAIETLYTPYELLAVINKIEKSNGRERIIHWGPRTLDMDIVLYEGCVMSEERLTIPHKEMVVREFVLRPLKDIAPYEIHPVLNKSVLELFENISVKNEV
jgi:dihydroneopterin aldolase/2-amino-4-hydroxy-6-hydroxymethyldihydropteridine diphosphokinase